MVRRNLFDILAMQDFNPTLELNKLQGMFEEEPTNGSHSFYWHINDDWFRHFPERGRFLSLGEMKTEINRIAILQGYSVLDHLLLYCEFIRFVFGQCFQSKEYATFAFGKYVPLIMEQINKILDASNHQWLQRNDGSYIVIEKNPVALEVAEIIPDENVATRVLEYNHFALKGDLEGKKTILKSIGDVVEPILKTKEWRSSAYSQLGSDAGFLLNNFNIRHNNMDGANKKDFLSTMTPEDLEQWYDKTYDCLLAVIMMNEQIQTSAEIKAIKKQMEE